MKLFQQYGRGSGGPRAGGEHKLRKKCKEIYCNRFLTKPNDKSTKATQIVEITTKTNVKKIVTKMVKL